VNQESRTLAIDLDGVIAKVREDLDYANCEVIPGAREALNALREKGWLIALHTARHFNHLTTTREWLERNNIPYDHLIMGKPTARFYIDDRAVEFSGCWEKIIERVNCP